MSPGLPPLRPRVGFTFRCVLVHVHALVLALALANASLAQDNAPFAAPPAAAPAEAQNSPCPGRHIILHAAADVPAELAREVQTDLATELGRRGLSVCTEGQSTLEPAAIVNLSLREKEAIIELDDRTTQKRVARDVRLDRVPPAGRALALAIAIDELLRASWAELTMREQEPKPARPAAPPRAESERESEPEPAPPRKPRQDTRGRLGAGLGTLHSRQDLHAFSVAVDGELELPSHLLLGLSLGPLVALPVEDALGSVRSYGATSALRAGTCLPAGKTVRGCGGAQLGVDYLYFRGDANHSARASAGGSWLVHAQALAGVAVDVAQRTRLRGDLTVGGAIHGVEASDGTHTLVGARGLLVGGQVLVQVEL